MAKTWKSRKANRHTKYIFKTVNVRDSKVKTPTHHLVQCKKQVASNEASKNQTQNKQKGLFFHTKFIKLLIPLPYNSESL